MAGGAGNLAHLPVEIFILIINFLNPKTDLLNLLQTCKAIHDVVVPFPWKKLEYEVWNDKKLPPDIDGSAAILRSEPKRIEYMKFVRDFVIKGTSILPERCPHNVRKGESYYGKMATDLLIVLVHLQENNLRSFSWISGTCLPPILLGIHGYLPSKQKNLESLTLILHPHCNEKPKNALYLTQFKVLKHFCLKGVCYDREQRPVRDMLNAAAKALISFELEVNSMFNRNPWPTKKLFPLSPPMTFPNLCSLNLTFVEFGDDGKDLAQAIDFTALTSLTLRKCRGWSRVLVEAFTSRNKAMELKWLEIQHDQPSEIDIHRLAHLLTNCPYLVNVSICHGQDSTNVSHTLLAQLWVALCTQKRFLKAMVVHLFDFFSETDIPSPSGDPRSPIPNDGLAALMTTSMWISVTNTSPLAYVNVEFLGLCSFPDETLEALLLPFQKKKCLRTLHIRKSSTDWRQFEDYYFKFRIFAQWVFGMNGIGSVNHLLLGNFTGKDTFTNKKPRLVIYARTNQSPFYTVVSRQDFIQQADPVHVDLTKICPLCIS